MTVALVDIANNAALKFGGFGDQLGGDGQVTAAQLTANATKDAKAVNTAYDTIRPKIFTEFAKDKCPFPESRK